MFHCTSRGIKLEIVFYEWFKKKKKKKKNQQTNNYIYNINNKNVCNNIIKVP